MPPDRGQHVEAAVGQHLDQAAAHEAPRRASAASSRPTPVTSASTSRETGDVMWASRRKQRCWSLVEQLVRRVHGLGERGGRHHVGDPDQGDLHGDLLDEQRQPAGGVQQAAYVARRARRGRPGARRRPPPGGRNRSTAGPASGSCGRGTAKGPTRTTRSAGCPAMVTEVTASRASVVDDTTLLEGRAQEGRGRGRAPSTTSRLSMPSTARHRAPCAESPGVGWHVERVEAGREDVLGAPDAAGVDPGALVPGGRVAGQQGLAAAGRADDGHPPRGRQGGRQALLRLLASETRGEHATNLAVRAPSIT